MFNEEGNGVQSEKCFFRMATVEGGAEGLRSNCIQLSPQSLPKNSAAVAGLSSLNAT